MVRAKLPSLLLLAPLVSTGCAAPAPPTPGPPRAAPAHDVVRDLATALPSAVAAPPATSEPTATPVASSAPVEVVARQLVQAWCRDAFGGPPGDTPADCSKVQIEIRHEREDGDMKSAVIALGIGTTFEASAHFLYLRAASTAVVVPLGHAWSSGAGGVSHTIDIDSVRVENVFGDAAPEWWAEITVASHDSDMGLCLETGKIERDLVLCTSNGRRVGCGRAPLVSVAYEDIVSTGAGCEPMRRTGSGFAQATRVTNAGISFTPSKEALGRHVITRPERAPFTGTATVNALLARALVENLCVSKKLSCPP